MRRKTMSGHTCDKCGKFVPLVNEEPLTVELGPIDDKLCGSCARGMIDDMVESYRADGIIQTNEAEREFRSKKWDSFRA